MTSMREKRVDWGTVRSKSGRIDTKLSSFCTSSPSFSCSPYPRVIPRSLDSDRSMSCGEQSLADIDDISEKTEGEQDKKKLADKPQAAGTRGGSDNDDDDALMRDSGHETDKTQAMQVSMQTLDVFVADEIPDASDDGGGGAGVGGGGDEVDAGVGIVASGGDIAENDNGEKRDSGDNDNGGGGEGNETVGEGGEKNPRGRKFLRRESLRSIEEQYKPIKVRCWRFRRVCAKIANHPKFQIFIVILILINSLMMGLGTFDFVMDDPQISSSFEKVDMVFLSIFTAEITMQLVYRGYMLFTDGWLVFDFVIVLLSWSLSSLQIVRAFRIFRALRLITRVETLRKLVTALMNVLPKMTAIFGLLLIVFYIFTVMFTVLFKDLYEQGLTDDDYFSSLTITLFTLFQMMTMDWSSVARQCMDVYPWAWAPFVLFIAISGFVVFNLIIAVVCDAVATVEHPDEVSAEDVGQDELSCSSCECYESGDKVKELRTRLEILLHNQVEMQNLVQSLVDMQRGKGSCQDTTQPTFADVDNNKVQPDDSSKEEDACSIIHQELPLTDCENSE